MLGVTGFVPLPPWLSAVLFCLSSCFAPVLFLAAKPDPPRPPPSPRLVPILFFFVLSCLELEEAGRDPPAPHFPAGETKKMNGNLGRGVLIFDPGGLFGGLLKGCFDFCLLGLREAGQTIS